MYKFSEMTPRVQRLRKLYRDTVPFQGLHSPEKEQMEHWAEIVRPYVPAVELRGVE